MGAKVIILADSLISNLRQSLRHSALMYEWNSVIKKKRVQKYEKILVKILLLEYLFTPPLLLSVTKKRIWS